MIVVEDIHRTFATRQGAIEAVKPTALEVEAGTLLTLLGPSGCGKTTMLRMIAGLEPPDGGRITLDGQVVFCAREGVDVPANRRDIGMVFQSYAVWPHMTVYENVAYPLRIQRLDRRSIRERVDRILALVGMEAMGGRRTTHLSGGQQQRVAIARALVPEPALLLLDEPFSNLDAHLRTQMGQELKELQRRLGVTTVYVTHDQEEALALSDELVLMNEGRIVQQGPPREVYRHPRSRFAAEFVGRSNLLSARADRTIDRGIHTLASPVGPLRVWVPEPQHPARRAFLVSIRPEDVRLTVTDDAVTGPGDADANHLQGEVVRVVFRGDAVDCDVEVADGMLRVRGVEAEPLATGDPVRLTVAPQRIVLLDDEAGDMTAATGAAPEEEAPHLGAFG